MNRKFTFSPTQKKACVVLALCALAIVLTFVCAWILPGKLNLSFGKGSYDPLLYPVDTSLNAVLGDASAGGDYLSTTVFVGDGFTEALKSDARITLDRYVAQKGLKVSEALGTQCAYFVNDANGYTIPQAISKMKPRRVIVCLGQQDIAEGSAPETVLQDYKQFLKSIASSYPHCDLIVSSTPPVLASSENAAQTQQALDLLNQSLAAACEELGYKFLNTAAVLKNAHGYAEDSYFDSATGIYNGAGVNTVLSFVLSHAYEGTDRRPDTNDIPVRAEAAASTNQPTPSATPHLFTASYTVEAGKGSLSGNGQTGVSSIEIQAQENETVTVTAVAAEGFVFFKWSDGQTNPTRYDVVQQNFSAKAMFNDARVELTLDRSDTTMKVGESITTNATVKLGGKDYSNSNVQWTINDELMNEEGGTFTFTPTEAGTYSIGAGVKINGTISKQEFKVTVEGLPTTLNVTGPTEIQVGTSTTLTATVENGVGDVTWSCDETSWTATGNQVQFTANQQGVYNLRARNNGVEAKFTLNVKPAPTPAPTPAPAPVPTPAPPESTGQPSENNS